MSNASAESAIDCVLSATQVTTRSWVWRVCIVLIAAQIASSTSARPRPPAMEILRAIEPRVVGMFMACRKVKIKEPRRAAPFRARGERSVQLVDQVHLGAGHQAFDVH